MTLPFAKPERNSKKYLCFCCGDEFKDYSELKEHILADHDEGREYLLCSECSNPVRDLNIHYKAVHPRQSIPSGIQTRALVLKDFGNKRKKGKKPNFHSGQFVSMKNNGKLMTYRSGWELQVFEFLEELEEIERYEVEAIKIPYFWLGKWHQYYPDIIVFFTAGHKEIWEIKPSNQKNLDRNQAKWDACAKFCNANGYRFKVQTENGIHQLRLKLISERRKT